MANKEQKTGLAHYVKEAKYPIWSLESFGQFLRSADFVSLDIFPHLVAFPKNNQFRKSLDHLLGSPLETRSYVEHLAVVATNDKGELRLSKVYEKGTPLWVKIKSGSEVDMAYLQAFPLPVGWRRLGIAHSHPREPIVGQLTYLIDDLMRGFRFSAADVAALLVGVPSMVPLEMVVTPTGYGLMVASEITKEQIKKHGLLPTANDEKSSVLDQIAAEITRELSFDPARMLNKYGIAYYSCASGKDLLKRVV